jgi:DNA-binding IclR family transcriptional regulator
MTSLARGLLVIQSFTPQTPQMSIAQLAAKTGISRAAVRRCLYTLAKLFVLQLALHRSPAHPGTHVGSAA